MNSFDLSIYEIVSRLPHGLVRVRGARPNSRRRAGTLVIAETASDVVPDAIVLAVSSPLRLLRASYERGAAVVAVRSRSPAQSEQLARAAREAGIVLLQVEGGHSWTEVHAALADALTLTHPARGDELANLAQTIGVMTLGLVSIEDMQAGVLAYSASANGVDELRRQSILGRAGPPTYLALLREWGVYDRLAVPDSVVEIDEHPESGVRRRLAVGVFAGHEQVGTIWVQQGADEFPPHARRALVGAARVAATEIAATRRRRETLRENQLAILLSGRTTSATPDLSARAASRPCVVAVFAIPDAGTDPAARMVLHDTLTGIARIQAATLRADAVTTEVDGQVCMLLPDLPDASIAIPMLRAVTSAANRFLRAQRARGHSVRAAIGPVVARPTDAERSFRGALQVLAACPSTPVAIFDDLRAHLLVNAALCVVARRTELQDPSLTNLSADLRQTLLAYCERSGDVTAVAAALNLHPTTVRYRLRKASQRLDLDLDDAEDRLAIHLQLAAAATINALTPTTPTNS